MFFSVPSALPGKMDDFELSQIQSRLIRSVLIRECWNTNSRALDAFCACLLPYACLNVFLERHVDIYLCKVIKVNM